MKPLKLAVGCPYSAVQPQYAAHPSHTLTHSLREGDTALFMTDAHGNYLALSVDGRTYYLNHSCIASFSQDLNSKGRMMESQDTWGFPITSSASPPHTLTHRQQHPTEVQHFNFRRYTIHWVTSAACETSILQVAATPSLGLLGDIMTGCQRQYGGMHVNSPMFLVVHPEQCWLCVMLCSVDLVYLTSIVMTGLVQFITTIGCS